MTPIKTWGFAASCTLRRSTWTAVSCNIFPTRRCSQINKFTAVTFVWITSCCRSQAPKEVLDCCWIETPSSDWSVNHNLIYNHMCWWFCSIKLFWTCASAASSLARARINKRRRRLFLWFCSRAFPLGTHPNILTHCPLLNSSRCRFFLRLLLLPFNRRAIITSWM